MNKRFYIGYIRNPYQVRNDDFNYFDEQEILIEEEDNIFREYFSKGKICIQDINKVFNGNKFNINNYNFIGRLDKEISMDYLKKYLQDINKDDLILKLQSIKKINLLTVKKSIEDRYYYLIDEINLINQFNGNNDLLSTDVKTNNL